jgi:hypothetical protein
VSWGGRHDEDRRRVSEVFPRAKADVTRLISTAGATQRLKHRGTSAFVEVGFSLELSDALWRVHFDRKYGCRPQSNGAFVGNVEQQGLVPLQVQLLHHCARQHSRPFRPNLTLSIGISEI